MSKPIVGGWNKDPWSSKDYIKPKISHRLLPTQVTLFEYVPPVRYQEAGDCVGQAVSANLGTEAKKLNVFVDIFSPTYIYNLSRNVIGELQRDEGCYPRDAMDMLLKYGCLLEKFWPYKGFETKMPTAQQFIEATKWPLFKYFRVDEGEVGIMSANAQGYSVAIGIPWPIKWMDSKDGILPEVKNTASIAGGHEVLIYGYNLSTKRFLGMNSWGTEDWSWKGDKVPKGHFSMPMSIIQFSKANGGYDAHFIEVKWPIQPKPPQPTTLTMIRLLKSINGGDTWVDLYDTTM